MFVIEKKIDELKEQIKNIEEERDFEYRDIIKMKNGDRQEKTELVKIKNILKEELKMLERFNIRKVPFNRDRYYKYKMLSNEELCKTAAENKYAANDLGGKEFAKIIKDFEGMRDELFWRAQAGIDIEEGLRSDYQKAQALNINRENNLEDVIVFFKSCTKIESEYADMMLEMPDYMRALSIKYEGKIVSACVYDADYKIYFIATCGEFADMKLGRRMFELVKELANEKERPIKALAKEDDPFIKNFKYMENMESKEFGKILYCQDGQL